MERFESRQSALERRHRAGAVPASTGQLPLGPVAAWAQQCQPRYLVPSVRHELRQRLPVLEGGERLEQRPRVRGHIWSVLEGLSGGDEAGLLRFTQGHLQPGLSWACARDVVHRVVQEGRELGYPLQRGAFRGPECAEGGTLT